MGPPAALSEDEVVAHKLAELYHFLLAERSGEDAGRSVHSFNDDTFHFGEVLFKRAPQNFLRQLSLPRMAQIADRAEAFYQNFLKSKRDFLIEVSPMPGWLDEENQRTSVLTAVDDRPFIVDSLSELMRAMNLRVHVLLHPIFRGTDSRVVSLIYLELEPNQGISEKQLFIKIQEILEDLVLVTNDFPALIHQARVGSELLARASAFGFAVDECREGSDFMHWLIDGGFIFLGYRQWHTVRIDTSLPLPAADPDRSFPPFVVALEANLGLFRSKTQEVKDELEQVARDGEYLLRSGSLVQFSKILLESPIHRHIRMDLVIIQTPSADERSMTIRGFLGLLTSKALAQEVLSIPLVRRKAKRIIEIEGVMPNTHDYKSVLTILDSMPKWELFEREEKLIRRDVDLIMSAHGESDIKVSFHSDVFGRYFSPLVIMPHQRFSGKVREDIQHCIEEECHARPGSAEYQLAVSGEFFARIHFSLPCSPSMERVVDKDILAQKIVRLALNWDDRLFEVLSQVFKNKKKKNGQHLNGPKLAAYYSQVFPQEYKTITLPEDAGCDIEKLERLSTEQNLELGLHQFPNQQAIFEYTSSSEPQEIVPTTSADFALSNIGRVYDLRIYKYGSELTLSAILPFLENAGLEIIRERTTLLVLKEGQQASIYNLCVRPKTSKTIDLEQAKKILLPGLKQVFLGNCENGPLNTLLLDAGLDWREVTLMRVLRRYLWQIRAFHSPNQITRTIIENPAIASLLVECFRTKFDPTAPFPNLEARQVEFDKVKTRFLLELKNVKQLIHDRVLRALFNVIEAAVRTNFYQLDQDLRIAVKFDCRKMQRLPNPRPLYEIFMVAPDVEGVHLRGGKVARGGIRWSDRIEDYRTEVMGLLKTQMVKNAIIIPVGAKGGFIVKNPPQDAKDLPGEVKRCYSRFIYSLLELADNLETPSTNSAKNNASRMIVYDDPDPYFVVAADKGTATFSDIANKIAGEDFDFWLGDAFASGGSNGYDHKKLAITAKGAWEAVCQHFREIGIDVESQEFTVVGIGDMSGDVFGNGLLRSKRAKLIAAFNHKHIFLDPNPVPRISFEERRRLFELPLSQWTDYQKGLLSLGGGIFERSEKEIVLNSEAKRALGIDSQVSMLSGDELIRAILKAPVDLLWNGGIGTYVKASFEDSIDVGDRANDDVRVDGKDLRAKVIAEGGNLGFTQLGRIEYSQIGGDNHLGGHINTDAIDNSAGVNLSDLEVNIKILLREPLKDGKISFGERNELLGSVAEEVCNKVTYRNLAQSKILTFDVYRSRRKLDYYRRLIAVFEQNHILDRKVEALPDEEVLAKRSQQKVGLTRPEIAVLIPYVKSEVVQTVLSSSLPEEPFLEKYLFEYFPRAIVDRFPEYIRRHPLRREIVATQIANMLVETVGAIAISRIAEETGNSEQEAIAEFLVVDEILGTRELLRQLEALLNTAKSFMAYFKGFLAIVRAIDGVMRWLLDHSSKKLDLSSRVKKYQGLFSSLIADTEKILPESERLQYGDAYQELVTSGYTCELAKKIAALAYSASYANIITISLAMNREMFQTAQLYMNLLSEFQVPHLFEQAKGFEPSDHFENLCLRRVTNELRDSIGLLTERMIEEEGQTSLDAMRSYLAKRGDLVKRYQETCLELQARPLTISALMVVSSQLMGIGGK